MEEFLKLSVDNILHVMEKCSNESLSMLYLTCKHLNEYTLPNKFITLDSAIQLQSLSLINMIKERNINFKHKHYNAILTTNNLQLISNTIIDKFLKEKIVNYHIHRVCSPSAFLYITNNCQYLPKDIFKNLILYEHYSIIKYLILHYPHTTYKIINEAQKINITDIELLKILISHGFAMNRYYVNIAITHDNLNYTKYVLDYFTKEDPVVCKSNINEHIKTSNKIASIVSSSKTNVVLWLLENDYYAHHFLYEFSVINDCLSQVVEILLKKYTLDKIPYCYFIDLIEQMSANTNTSITFAQLSTFINNNLTPEIVYYLFSKNISVDIDNNIFSLKTINYDKIVTHLINFKNYDTLQEIIIKAQMTRYKFSIDTLALLTNSPIKNNTINYLIEYIINCTTTIDNVYIKFILEYKHDNIFDMFIDLIMLNKSCLLKVLYGGTPHMIHVVTNSKENLQLCYTVLSGLEFACGKKLLYKGNNYILQKIYVDSCKINVVSNMSIVIFNKYVRYCKSNIIEYMLQNINMCDYPDLLNVAIRYRKLEIIKLIMKHGYKFDKNSHKFLIGSKYPNVVDWIATNYEF